MTTVFEINGAFSEQSRLISPDLGAHFRPVPAKRRGCQASGLFRQQWEDTAPACLEVNACVSETCQSASARSEARLEAFGFAGAALFVAGLGALGAWALVLMFQSLMQAQTLMVQNSFAFQH